MFWGQNLNHMRPEKNMKVCKKTSLFKDAYSRCMYGCIQPKGAHCRKLWKV